MKEDNKPPSRPPSSSPAHPPSAGAHHAPAHPPSAGAHHAPAHPPSAAGAHHASAHPPSAGAHHAAGHPPTASGSHAGSHSQPHGSHHPQAHHEISMAMVMEEVQIPELKLSGGSPAWMITFADLMTLLMCFFVVLLSFSELDLQKYKQVVYSMRKAFVGMQAGEGAAVNLPGTSQIIQSFSPQKSATSLQEIWNKPAEDNAVEQLLKIEQKERADEELRTSKNAQKIADDLIEEIRAGLVEVETKGNKIVIRILEKGSFPSGSANLRIEFLPTLRKIAKVLINNSGQITVAGFTDNIPIQTDLFRSNWELSASRAFSVINELLKDPELDSKRFSLMGNADNDPIAANDTDSNRTKNRRVELIILQGREYEKQSALENYKNVEDRSSGGSVSNSNGQNSQATSLIQKREKEALHDYPIASTSSSEKNETGNLKPDGTPKFSAEPLVELPSELEPF